MQYISDIYIYISAIYCQLGDWYLYHLLREPGNTLPIAAVLVPTSCQVLRPSKLQSSRRQRRRALGNGEPRGAWPAECGGGGGDDPWTFEWCQVGRGRWGWLDGNRWRIEGWRDMFMYCISYEILRFYILYICLIDLWDFIGFRWRC